MRDAKHGSAERLLCKYRIDDNGCWSWLRPGHRGYGGFSMHGRKCAAHRVVYEMMRGPIPAGLELDHLCRNRACVNPDHLEPVPGKVNVLRGNGMGARYARRSPEERQRSAERQRKRRNAMAREHYPLIAEASRERCRNYYARRAAA